MNAPVPLPNVADRPVDARGSADSHAMRYRPFIDGLRAVAVLSVVAFHFSKTALPGDARTC